MSGLTLVYFWCFLFPCYAFAVLFLRLTLNFCSQESCPSDALALSPKCWDFRCMLAHSELDLLFDFYIRLRERNLLPFISRVVHVSLQDESIFPTICCLLHSSQKAKKGDSDVPASVFGASPQDLISFF